MGLVYQLSAYKLLFFFSKMAARRAVKRRTKKRRTTRRRVTKRRRTKRKRVVRRRKKRRAKVRGSRRQVWNGSRMETPGSLEKSNLMKNKRGRIVSKKASKAGKA